MAGGHGARPRRERGDAAAVTEDVVAPQTQVHEVADALLVAADEQTALRTCGGAICDA